MSALYLLYRWPKKRARPSNERQEEAGGWNVATSEVVCVAGLSFSAPSRPAVQRILFIYGIGSKVPPYTLDLLRKPRPQATPKPPSPLTDAPCYTHSYITSMLVALIPAPKPQA
jgi:hypothetical protein